MTEQPAQHDHSLQAQRRQLNAAIQAGDYERAAEIKAAILETQQSNMSQVQDL